MRKSSILPLVLFFLLIGRIVFAQSVEPAVYLPMLHGSAFEPAVVSFEVAYASNCIDAPANDTPPPAAFPNDVAKLALRTTLDGANGNEAKVVWILEDVPVYEQGFDVEEDRVEIESVYFGQPFTCGRQLIPGTYRVQLFAADQLLFEGQVEIAP